MTTRRLLVCSLLAVALAGGCADAQEETSAARPTTTVVATTAQSTTTAVAVTTTAPAPEPPEVISDESRLSFRGLGVVRAGMSLEEVERASGVAMTRTKLPACVALSPTDSPRGVEFIFPDGGALEFVFARAGSRIRTESGVGLGDDEATVMRAHPDAEVMNPDREVHRIVVRPTRGDRRLLFEIDRGRVGVIWSGPPGSELAEEICS